MKKRPLQAAVAAVLAGSCSSVPSIVLAQEDAGSGALEEIIVTATRRAQNLQEVPVSIVALTGESLEMQGLDSLEDVGTTFRISTFRAVRSRPARSSAFAGCPTSASTSTASGRSTRP